MTPRVIRSSGFAMLLVLWIVVVLSALALSAFLAVDAQARITSSEREALSAEQLAHSGQEFAGYLALRGLGTPAEDLSGLPVDVLVPGFHYRVRFPNGAVDLYLESETGKINPATAPQPILENFFSLWTGSATEGNRITAAIQDWQDPDDDERIDGAEALSYSGSGYLPRNGSLGIADLALIRGLTFDDFRPKYTTLQTGAEFRYGLNSFMTSGPQSATINPNFSPEVVLQSIPGLTTGEVAAIMRVRQTEFFRSADQFQSLTGVSPNSIALKYLSFNRGSTPVMLSIARLNGSAITRSERRVYFSFSSLNQSTGVLENQSSLVFVEHNVLPDFIAP